MWELATTANKSRSRRDEYIIDDFREISQLQSCCNITRPVNPPLASLHLQQFDYYGWCRQFYTRHIPNSSFEYTFLSARNRKKCWHTYLCGRTIWVLKGTCMHCCTQINFIIIATGCYIEISRLIGWGTEAELKVTDHALIIDHNTLQHYSLEIQLCCSSLGTLRAKSLI